VSGHPLFVWVLLGVFALGVYLIVRPLLEFIGDLLGGAVSYIRYQMQPKLFRLLEDRGDRSFRAFVQSGDGSESERSFILASLLHLRITWIAGAILATILVYDGLRSPAIFVIIVVGGELYRSREDYRRTSKLNDDAGNLVLQFVSRYPLTHSAKKTLQGAATILPKGRVKNSVETCLSYLDAGQAPQDALQPLREIRHPILSRFASIVVIAQDTDMPVLTETLELLSDDVESRLDLRRQSRRSLTLVRGTVRVLQVVVVVALGMVTVLPAWRGYFLASSKNWLMLMSMIVVTAVSSLYVEAEMRQLEI